MESIVFDCPHCFDTVIVNIHEINCGIFRHAVFKDTLEQINPHLPKDLCDKLIEEGRILGCAKPFQIKKIDEKFMVEICDYI
jgi:hypothetical protein